jgi:hypothetical protein
LGKGKVQHEKKRKLKKSEIQANKYYSAPVSTKENGLVTKFKFKNDTQKIPTKKSIEEEEFQKSLKADTSGPKMKESESGTRKSAKDEAHMSEMQLSKFDISMPKNEDIQKIFSDAVNSPSDKVIHMSVINSLDNFEEEKEKSSNNSNSNSNKAAVPILDFTNLPSDKKSKTSEYTFDQD